MAVTEPPGVVIERLRELIVALDRRVPHLEREGEAAIARDAAELKWRAERRIRELEAGLTPPVQGPPASGPAPRRTGEDRS
jgi:hypothetical protein